MVKADGRRQHAGLAAAAAASARALGRRRRALAILLLLLLARGARGRRPAAAHAARHTAGAPRRVGRDVPHEALAAEAAHRPALGGRQHEIVVDARLVHRRAADLDDLEAARGFEHAVANMYFIPLGLLIKAGAEEGFWQAVRLDPAAFGALDMAGAARNLAAVTLGNITGGALLVAGAYWLLYRRGQRE